MNNLNNDFKKALKFFEQRLDEFGLDSYIYESFFATLKIQDIVENDVIITTDLQWNREPILAHLDKLEEIYNIVTNGDYHLVLYVEDEYEKSNEKNEVLLEFEDNLNADLNFNTFVVGNSNRIAQTAALTVAMKPGISYSPLFIFGQSGLGKTHLLNAIGNYAKQKNPNTRVLYSTSENFVNEYIQSLSNHKMDEFNYKYRHIDILLIDDIQFMAAKDSSCEIFFNIFNTLISNSTDYRNTNI